MPWRSLSPRPRLFTTILAACSLPCLAIASAPTIVRAPANLSLQGEQVGVLRVEADGTQPFTYEWFQQVAGSADPAIPIADSDTPILTVSAAANGSWDFFARVSNAFGSVDSPPARVTRTVPSPVQQASFESDQGYALGNIHGQQGWAFSGSGSATVVADGIAGRSLRLTPGSSTATPVGAAFGPAQNFGTSNTVLWEITLRHVASTNGHENRFGVFLHDGSATLAEIVFQMDNDGRIFAIRDRDDGSLSDTTYRLTAGGTLNLRIYVDFATLRYTALAEDAVIVPSTGLILPGGRPATPTRLGVFVRAAVAGQPGNGGVLADDLRSSFRSVFPGPRLSAFTPPPSGAEGIDLTGKATLQGWGFISHQWYRGDIGDTSEPVAGAVEAELTAAAEVPAGRYWLRSSNRWGVLDSPVQEFGGGAAAWRRFDFLSLPQTFQRRRAALDGERLFVAADGGGAGTIRIFEATGDRPDFSPAGTVQQPESIFGYTFGAALAAAGDWLFAGTPATPFQPIPGKVYFFRRDPGSGTWSHQKTLQAPDAGSVGDRFGAALATDGDWLFVGAPDATVGGTTMRGAVHVYRRDQGGAGNWGFVRTLAPSGLAGGAQFGAALSLDGGLLAVGAPSHAAAQSWETQGAVAVFHRDQGGSGVWGQRAILTPGAGNSFHRFGSTLQLSGTALAVGAPGAPLFGLSSFGEVTVWTDPSGAGNAWTQRNRFSARLGLTNSETRGGFGQHLALRGDRLLASAAGLATADPGEVVIIERVAGTESWAETGRVILPGQITSWDDLLLTGDLGLVVSHNEIGLIGPNRERRPPQVDGTTPLALPQLARFTAADGIAGSTLQALLGARLYDGDGRPWRVAISATAGEVAGTWQFRPAGTLPWIDLPPVSAASAWLLGPEDEIRFVPVSGAFGEASLTLQAIAGARATGTAIDLASIPADAISEAVSLAQLVFDTNTQPAFTSAPIRTAYDGVPYTYTVRASDPDSAQVLTFAAPVLPEWLSLAALDPRSARLSGTPPAGLTGSFPVTLTVSDGDTGFATQSFELELLPADAPAWVAQAVWRRDDLLNVTINGFAASGHTVAFSANLGSSQQRVQLLDLRPLGPDGQEWVSAGAVSGTETLGVVELEGTTLAVAIPSAVVATAEGTLVSGGRVEIRERHLAGPNSWGVLRALTSPEPRSGAGFGSRLILAQDRLVASENEFFSNPPRPARLHVFERDRGGSGQWGLEATLEPPNGRGFTFSSVQSLTGDGTWIAVALSQGGLGLYQRTGQDWSFHGELLTGVWISQIHLDDGLLVATRQEGSTRAMEAWRLNASGTTWDPAGSLVADSSSLFQGAISLRPGLVAAIHQNDPEVGGRSVRIFDSTGADAAGWPSTGWLAFNAQGNSFGQWIRPLADGFVVANSQSSATHPVAYFSLGVGNVAPTLLDPTPVLLAAFDEDTADASLPTWSVAALAAQFGYDFNDNALGFAASVEANIPAQGSWQVQLQIGGIWQNLTSVAPNVFLLPPEAHLRFRPAPDFAGTPPGLVVRLWDQTTGTAGQGFNLAGFGGKTAFSADAVTLTVIVNEVPDAPVIAAPAQWLVDSGDSVLLTVTVSDVDVGDSVSLTAQGLPTWLDLAPGELPLTWTLAGTVPVDAGAATLTLLATDSYGLTTARALSIRVRSGAAAPPITFPNFSTTPIRAIALDGDWAAVSPIVTTTDNLGRVHLFRRDSGTGDWVLARTVTGTTHDFGAAVALQGDTLVIGASTARYVYFHRRDQGGTDNWGQTAAFESPVALGITGDFFGTRLALDGDILVVGAPRQYRGGPFLGPSTFRGAAHLYQRATNGTWSYLKELPGVGSNAQAGSAVAVHGSVVVMGLPGTSAFHIYERDHGGPNEWGLAAAFSVAGGGGSLAVEGDHIVASGNIEGARVRHYRRSEAGIWSQGTPIADPVGHLSPDFPATPLVALRQGRLAVGHSRALSLGDGIPRGAVYLYGWSEAGDAWLPEGIILPRFLQADARFGSQVDHDAQHLIVARTGSVNAGQTLAGLVEIHSLADLDLPPPMLGNGATVTHTQVQGNPVPLSAATLAAAHPDPVGRPLGVALIASTPGTGAWEYRLGPDAEWLDLPGDLGPSAALLLGPAAQLRYTPASSAMTGAVADALRFRLWDVDPELVGSRTELAAMAGNLSAGAAKVDVQILPYVPPANTPPTFLDLTPIEVEQPRGEILVWRLGDLVGGRLADAETLDPEDLAILVTGSAPALGNVQYSTNGGTSWLNLYNSSVNPTIAPSQTTAWTLRPSVLLRQNSTNVSTVTLSLRVSDQPNASSGAVTNANEPPGEALVSADALAVIFRTVEVPRPPVLGTILLDALVTGQPVRGRITATDPNPGEVLNFSVNGPAWLSVEPGANATSAVFAGTPTEPGQIDLLVTVTDATGLTDSRSLSVPVLPAGTPPAWGFDTGATWTLGEVSGAGSSASGLPTAHLLTADGLHLIGYPTAANIGRVALMRRDPASGEWTSAGAILPPTGFSGMRFGEVLAWSDPFLFVGAPNTLSSGRVHVYERDSSGADTFVHRLELGSSASFNSRFGAALAVADDLLAIGVPQESNSEFVTTGRVRLHRRNQGGANQWGEIKVVDATTSVGGLGFGTSLALTADWLLVGAPGAADGGMAALFGANTGGTGNWGLAQTLIRPGTAAFGSAVALSGLDAWVGAPNEAGHGVVHRFSHDQGGANSWGWADSWTSPVSAAHGETGSSAPARRFGAALASTADALAITAPGEPGPALSRGAVHVLRRDGASWRPDLRLVAPMPGLTLPTVPAALTPTHAAIALGPRGGAYSVPLDTPPDTHSPLILPDTHSPLADILPDTHSPLILPTVLASPSVRQDATANDVPGFTATALAAGWLDPLGRAPRLLLDQWNDGPATWQWRPRGGSWQAVPAGGLPLGPFDEVRMIPTGDVSGNIPEAVYAELLTVGPAGDNASALGWLAFLIERVNVAPTAPDSLDRTVRVRRGEPAAVTFSIAELVGDAVSDPDSPEVGIALLDVDRTAGTWSWRTGSDAAWQEVPAVNAFGALLLGPAAELQLSPAAGFDPRTTPLRIDFRAWDGDSGTTGDLAYLASPDGNASPAVASVTTAGGVTVIWQLELHLAAVPAEGGNVTGGGWHDEGSLAPITANPAPGFTFTGWTGPATDPAAAVTSVLMDDHRSLTAGFLVSLPPSIPVTRLVAITGGWRIDFTGEAGVSYQLESSIDLKTWSAVGTPVSGSGTALSIEAPATTDTRRFYRLTATR